MADQPAQSTAERTADILAMAAVEAAAPGADTENAYECPFCVMMRKGGCEEPFKGFMECGEKADKGEIEMVECLKEFEALNKCMEKNKDMFDGLLSEMKEEEERVKQQEGQQEDSSTATAAAAPGVTTHQQAAKSVSSPQRQEPATGSTVGHKTQEAGSSRGHAEGVPATM